MINIRLVDPAAEPDVVGRLVGNYLRQTEREKAQRGLAAPAADTALPARYEREISHPAEAFENCQVVMAAVDGVPAGIVVTQSVADVIEIKRLWVEPQHRGKSVGSALIEHVLAFTHADIYRLTVWDWREPALATYRRLGFEIVESWDPRAHLVCLQRVG
ncbi:GNAT family N-acetyltransferase [Mycetocola zhujimingii]|uniref:GNAT family N-acetyltransferase n=1 Tax=Mycetocola zhujimingii TaxID=2079792 RepID=UPI000D3479E0|nr:GNAT family N-acetyltransferase [Mycetocola zhujimingii]AWB85649.1 GNAT family N-acetyltransferase [Mycetocola zhujimingii]